MSDSSPRSDKRFFSPLSRVIAREYEKALCACVSFLLLLVWLEMHKLQFNLSRIFKNIYEVTVFVINWAWLRCEAPSLLSYPGFLRNIGATHVTVSVAHWFDSRIFFNDSSMYQIHPICKIAIFQFPYFLGAKDMPDSLVSKRWKYRIIKSNLLGLQSKLAESGGLSVLENNQLYRWRANWTLQCSKRFVTKTFLL